MRYVWGTKIWVSNRHILTSKCLFLKIFGRVTCKDHGRSLLAKFHFLSGYLFKFRRVILDQQDIWHIVSKRKVKKGNVLYNELLYRQSMVFPHFLSKHFWLDSSLLGIQLIASNWVKMTSPASKKFSNIAKINICHLIFILLQEWRHLVSYSNKIIYYSSVGCK